MSIAAGTDTGIRTAVYDWLRTGDELRTALGPESTEDDPSVFPHGAPAHRRFPYIVFKRSDSVEARTLSKTRDGLRGGLFSFEVWGDDAFVVERVAEALASRLEQMPGPRGNVSVRAIDLQGEVDDAVRPEDGSEVTWFVTVLTARLTYRAVPSGA